MIWFWPNSILTSSDLNDMKTLGRIQVFCFWMYQNKCQNAKPHIVTSSILQILTQDLKDMDVLWTFKIDIDRQNLVHGCIKDQWPYSNQDQDAKPQSGTSSVLQSPKWGLKGHWYSLHLQNKDREPKFGSWVNQRPVTISKSGSRCQTPVRNLQRPPKPQMRT